MNVDFHAHYIPAGCESFEFPVASNGQPAGWHWDRENGTVRIGGRLRAIPGAADAPWFSELPKGILTSTDVRIAWMDEVGLDVQVLSPPPYLCLYETSIDDGWRSARVLNEGIAEVVRTFPSRFSGFATLPMQDPALAARELEYCVTELGMLGAQLLTNVNGKDLDEVEFLPFWDVVNDLKVPLFLHPHLPTDRRRMRHHYLVNTIGNPHETALASLFHAASRSTF